MFLNGACRARRKAGLLPAVPAGWGVRDPATDPALVELGTIRLVAKARCSAMRAHGDTQRLLGSCRISPTSSAAVLWFQAVSATRSGMHGLCGLRHPIMLSHVWRRGLRPCSPISFQVVGDETLAQLKRRVTACGFYSGPARMEAMLGRLGLENANAHVWDQMIMETAPQRLSFAPTRLDLADVEATPLRTRKAHPPARL